MVRVRKSRVWITFFGALIGVASFAKASEVPVTCGSVVKLRHESSGYHLHSHTIKWGGGSGQQSVTAHGSEDDQGGLWIVKEGDGALPCEAGEPVECGSVVRLEHMLTGKNLHSHPFQSPLSRNQEVSGFGDAGEGDGGDSWQLECVRRTSNNLWMKGTSVRLKHVDTRKNLHATTSYKFTQQNCPNCPIVGQMEVSALAGSGSATNWKADQGVYLGASM